MDIFKIDSPFMRTLGVLADLMILNVLTVLLCIPIVTAGASFTAMHYVLLKIARGEEGYIIRSYFKAFKQNFLQATLIWIGMLLICVALFVDWRILRMQGESFSGVFLVLLFAAALVVYLVGLYVFPVLSRYTNTIRGTLKTAFSMAVFGILTLRTILMGVLFLLPFFLLWLFGSGLIPVFAVFCFTGSGFFRAKLYSGLFKQYEEKGGVEQVDTDRAWNIDEAMGDAEDTEG